MQGNSIVTVINAFAVGSANDCRVMCTWLELGINGSGMFHHSMQFQSSIPIRSMDIYTSLYIATFKGWTIAVQETDSNQAGSGFQSLINALGHSSHGPLEPEETSP